MTVFFFLPCLCVLYPPVCCWNPQNVSVAGQIKAPAQSGRRMKRPRPCVSGCVPSVPLLSCFHGLSAGSTAIDCDAAEIQETHSGVSLPLKYVLLS